MSAESAGISWCRWLGHRWGIASWPTGQRWCERCHISLTEASRFKHRKSPGGRS